MLKLFLVCALSLPASHFTRPVIVSYHMANGNEEERLRRWLRKNNPDAEIFIHDNPQEDLLKEHGFEKVPFTWRGKQIWIRRKEKSDQHKLQEAA